MDVSQAQDKLAALESDLKELEVALCYLIQLLAFVLTITHLYRRIQNRYFVGWFGGAHFEPSRGPKDKNIRTLCP